MTHEFEPWYVKLIRETFAYDPEKPTMWAPLWALINIGSLVTLPGVFAFLNTFLDEPLFIAAGFSVLGPVCAASLLDGRFRTFAILTLSTWATMFSFLYGWSLTDGWRRDCGLGQGFAIMFTVIGAVAYPVVSGIVYAIGHAISRKSPRAVD